MDLPVFQHIDQLVGVGLVERHAIAEPKMMHNARRWILQGEDLHLAGLVEGPQVLEQKGVVARLDANDVMRASLTQVAEVGGVGAEGVFDDDHRQMGMLLAKLFEPAAGGVPLAVVLGLAVLLDDRLGCQRDDFLEVGMDQGGPQQLMGIGDAAVAMVLLQARGAMDLGGGEIGRAVQRHQVMAVQIGEAFEHLAALQATENLAERGPQVCGIDRIENGPHLGVGGDAVDAIDGAEVVVGVAAAVVEGQQGRVFEREHREGRHQGIAQGDFDLARPRIGKGAEMGAERSEEGVGGEILPCFTESNSHSEPLHRLKR